MGRDKFDGQKEPSEPHMAGTRMKQGKHKGTKFEALLRVV